MSLGIAPKADEHLLESSKAGGRPSNCSARVVPLDKPAHSEGTPADGEPDVTDVSFPLYRCFAAARTMRRVTRLTDCVIEGKESPSPVAD